MNLLNESETQKLATLSESFKEQTAKEIKNLDSGDREKLKDQIHCTELSLKGFMSGKFIVTCIGMLKAGKSTLVNLLARNKNASPTGFGFDTTLRPALITYSDNEEGSIDIWLQSNPGTSLTKANLREIFQHLRDTDTNGKLKCASRHEYPLNEHNLENALCKTVGNADNNMLPSEPAMVVVKVPGSKNSLLSEDIFILDTPGLDSGASEWTKQGWYEWIIENSDLILFLQSSFAPLNKEAAKVLDGIKARNNEIPVWLLQNEMIGKPWLEPGKIKMINDEQREKAAQMFDKMKKCFKKLYANLGKADTVIFDDSFSPDKKEALMKDSSFESVEENIRKDLGDNMGPIRRTNCIAQVKKDVQDLQKMLDDCQNKLNEKATKLKKKISERKDVKNSITDLLRNPPDGITFNCVSEINEILFQEGAPFQKNTFCHLLEGIRNHAFEEKDKYDKEDIENTIKEALEQLRKKVKESIDNTTNANFILKRAKDDGNQKSCLNVLMDTFTDFVVKVTNNVITGENFSRDQIKGWTLLDINPPTFKPQNVKVDQIFDLRIVIEKQTRLIFFEKSRTSKDAWGLFHNYYNPANSSSPGKFVKCIDECEKALKEEMLTWLNRKAFSIMREEFIIKFGEKIDGFINKEEEDLKRCEVDIAVIAEMQTACKEVISTMETF